jgi:hypothetical protein
MSSWGNNDNAANAPFWAVNSTIAHGGAGAAPTAANAALLYGNTTPDVYTTDATVGLFMIDTTEISAGSDNVTGVSIVNKGAGYVEAPGVTFSGGGGSSAAASASITAGGKVSKIIITNTGSSYETVPTVTVQVPLMTIPTTAVTTAANTITYVGHSQANSASLTYNNGGGTTMAGLTSGNTYYAIVVDANTIALATSTANAANNVQVDITGTGNNGQYFIIDAGTRATAVAEKGLGADGDGNASSERAVHSGWNLKTTGSGGRAGRVQIETLVAISEIKGDGSDDLTAPDA